MNPKKAKISWLDVCKPKQEGGLGLRNLRDANDVCCLKLIWRIVSQENSLWARWIKMHLIKGESFWSVRDNTNAGSWIWKKLLKYRDVAKIFCKVEVGNGASTSFWFDNWTSKGCLFDLTGPRGVIDLGIRKNASLLQAFRNRRRRRHRWHQNRHEDKVDVFLWRGQKDVYKPSFSTKDTWSHTRTTSNKVAWHKGVWFTHATPKFCFCT